MKNTPKNYLIFRHLATFLAATLVTLLCVGLCSLSTPAVAEQKDTVNDPPPMEKQRTALSLYMAKNRLLDLDLLKMHIEHPDHSAAEREILLYDFLKHMHHRTPEITVRDYILSLEHSHVSQLTTPHPEGPLKLTTYPIRATAKGLRLKWLSEEAEDNTLKQSRIGKLTFLDTFGNKINETNKAERLGILRALQYMPKTELLRVHDSALNRNNEQMLDILTITSVRLKDKNALSTLVSTYQSPRLLSTIKKIPEAFGRSEAESLLIATTKNRHLGSNAIFAMTDMLPSVQLESFLLKTLEDEHLGGSAAAVLARVDRADILQVIGSRLQNPSFQHAHARYVLALRLNNSRYARELISAYIQQGASSPLKSEIAAWLQKS